MANLNKVMLIGRLTADPEVRTFANGGKVAKVRFAVNNRKKNSQTGQWEDVPMYIDCEAFNRGEFGKQADLVEQYLSKGRQVYFEGRLELDQWDDKTTGQKRSKHKVVIENIQFLDSGQRDGARPPRQDSASPAPDAYVGDDAPSGPAPTVGNEEIPF
jgi:single-strand DNA-binding protein